MAEKSNPANVAETRKEDPTRIPMSIPIATLGVPEMDGWHLHWFLGKNVNRALRAGYRHVEDDEVELSGSGVANDMGQSGNTDLGTHISVLASKNEDIGEGREPSRLYLMKLPQRLWEEDQKLVENRNEQVASALRSGIVGGEKDPDKAKRYLKQGQDLFIPKT